MRGRAGEWALPSPPPAFLLLLSYLLASEARSIADGASDSKIEILRPRDGEVVGESTVLEFRFHDACEGNCRPDKLKIFLNSALMHLSPFDCALHNSSWNVPSIPSGRHELSLVLEDPSLFVCLIGNVKISRPTVADPDINRRKFREDQFSVSYMESLDERAEVKLCLSRDGKADGL
eukprot:766221-Hanusia_phi.AAC.1